MRQDPSLKHRNLKKTVVKAAETAMNVPASVAGVVTRRFSANATPADEENLPAYERPGASSGDRQVSEGVWQGVYEFKLYSRL